MHVLSSMVLLKSLNKFLLKDFEYVNYLKKKQEMHHSSTVPVRFFPIVWKLGIPPLTSN